MAYDNNGARIGAAGHFASRLTAALINAGGIEATEASASATFADLTADCLAVLNTLEDVSQASAPSPLKAAAFTEAFGATEVAQPVATPGGAVRIVGGNGEPVPAWLFEKAAAAGVTAVYDNRGDLAQNPKRPWFKQAEPKPATPRDAKGFWPN